MSEITPVGQKRKGGQKLDTMFLVVTESTREPGTRNLRHSCGEYILAVEVTHPVWEQPESLAGSGRVHTEMVPYCPRCEEPPSPHGAPIEE